MSVPRSRRTALAGLGAASLAAVVAQLRLPNVLAQATPTPSGTLSVPPGDPAVEVFATPHPANFPYKGKIGDYRWYEARPSDWRESISTTGGEGWFRVVLVCHDHAGLTPHVEEITRRLAKAGFVWLALDLLSPSGGIEAVADPASILTVENADQFVAAYQELMTVYASGPPIEDRFAAVGFGFGADLAWRLAAQEPRLNAAVLFSGSPPADLQVPHLAAAILGIYAAGDPPLVRDLAELAATALANTEAKHQFITYPGTAAGFYDETGPNYDAEPARAAWTAAVAWLDDHLGPDSPYA